MLEVFLLMIAAAAQSGVGSISSVSTGSVIVPRSQAPAVAFLAPAPTKDKTEAAAPAFLAPVEDQTAAALPAFLAPIPAGTEVTTAPAPVFLAPAAKPALVAEPQTPTGRYTTATEVKPILTATRDSWVSVRDDFNNQDILYVTHLWAWRCGLLELRVGINGNEPEVWPLPECHMDRPSPGAILDGDGSPYRSYALGTITSIEIEITYDDLTTDSAKYNRYGLLIP